MFIMTSAEFGATDVEYSDICESHSQWYMVSCKQSTDIFSHKRMTRKRKVFAFFGMVVHQPSFPPAPGNMHSLNALNFALWK
jgi:hypothetical protein